MDRIRTQDERTTGEPDRAPGAGEPSPEARARTEEILRESEARFRTLADNIAQLAWMADPSGWIFWYNERWFEYTGTTFGEMEGWGWQAVHHPDHVERVTDRFRRSVEAGEEWEDTFPLRGKDGLFRWFLSRALPIRDERGEVLRWFGTNTDITERMEMEEALREADRRKDEFLATLAHELRNPLAPIASGLELLRMAADDEEVRERTLGTLERQTRHLVRLVDDLLDVSRITRGKIELRRERLDLEAVVDGAVEASRPAIDEAGHRLEVVLPAAAVALEGDATRLVQIFSNLLNNAAQHTPPGGTVRLEAVLEDGGLAISVIDSGFGLPPEMLERVFDMFVQGEGEERGDRTGLGIGLTLVRSLVELHGGTVAATSPGRGGGASFTVRLPVAGPARTAAPESAEPESRPTVDGAPRRLRILIADDNRDAADGLRELLDRLGHDTQAVYDGGAALASGADHRPDVVLLDLGMPGLDGYETARRLRETGWGRELVLVALTGWGQERDRERTRAAGFDHHLIKPADVARLRALLADVTPRSERSREAPGG